ncbi:hypothetical protein Tco_1160358 [Tanacetum coccineum]
MLLSRLYHHVMGDYPHLAGPRYVFYDLAMIYLDAPTTRKPRKYIGVKRGRQYTSSSSSFHHGSSSRRDDDDEDMHDEGTSRQKRTPSPTTYYHYLSTIVPQTFVNPLKNDQTMSTMFIRQTSMLNRQETMHLEQRGALKLTRKAF